MRRITNLIHCIVFFAVSSASAVDTHCEHQKLIAFDAAAGANFGYAVAMDSDMLVVGANHATVNVTNEGAVYIYQRTSTTGNAWTLVKKIFASDNFPADQFGASIDISGDTLIVGSPFDDDNCPGMGLCSSGSAYIYQRNVGGANNWGFVAKLHASNPSSNGFFGRSVGISGDWAIAGQHGTFDGGAAYLFSRNQGGANNWGFVQRIQGADVVNIDQSGWAVDIDGDYCIFSAHKKTVNAEADAGAAYVFQRAGIVWTQTAKLFAPDAANGDNLGYDVAINGTRALVGSPFDDDGGSASGSINIFEKNTLGAAWSHIRKQVAGDPAGDDQYGLAVSLNSNHVVAGAYFKLNGRGAAYIHDQNFGGANNWGQLAKVVAFDSTASVNFGWTVAVAGEWAAVGAYQESSAAVTAGAVYIVFLGDRDCDNNDVCDDLEIAQNPSLDQDNNGILDACQCATDLTNSSAGPPDGVIDVFDLFLLLSNWNTNGPGAGIAPPTNIVDVFDLFALLGDWGPC